MMNWFNLFGKSVKYVDWTCPVRELYLEAQLLDTALGLAQVLLGVGVSPLLAIELVFQLAHALLQLLNGLLAALESVRLGLVQAHLQLLDLRFQGLAQLLLGLGVILLGAQLVGQPGGVYHRLLRLLLGVLRLVQQLVQVGLGKAKRNAEGYATHRSPSG